MKVVRKLNRDLTGQIISLTCQLWKVTRADLVGKARRRPLPWARAMLCEYLRRYAGHDSVTCSAILNRTYEGVSHYQLHYTEYMQTYVQFRDIDTEMRKRLKEITAKQPAK